MPWAPLVTKNMARLDFIDDVETTLLKFQNWLWLEKINLKKDSSKLNTSCRTSIYHTSLVTCRTDYRAVPENILIRINSVNFHD